MAQGIPFSEAIRTPEWALVALAEMTHPRAFDTQE